MAQAAIALAKCKVDAAAPRLIALLTHPARAAAIEALALLAVPALLDALAPILADETDEARKAAVWAVYHFAREVSVFRRLELSDDQLKELVGFARLVGDHPDVVSAIVDVRDSYMPTRAGDREGLSRVIYVPRLTGKACLDELGKVPWATLPHAYQLRPPHTPDLLRQLTSPDEDTRRDAENELLSVLWHQGSIFVQTAHSVPFLVALDAGGAAVEALHVLRLIWRAAKDDGSPIARKVRDAFDACAALVPHMTGSPFEDQEDDGDEEDGGEDPS